MLTGKPSSSQVNAVSYCVLYELRADSFSKLRSEFEKTFLGFEQAAKLEAKEVKKKMARQAKKRHKTGKGDDLGLGGEQLPLEAGEDELAVGARHTVVNGRVGPVEGVE